MDRYRYSGEHVDKDKNRGINTTIYPKLNPTSNDLYVISREGDRLDILANKYYKDISKWWIIASANNMGKGTLEVPSGIQLRIPMNVPEYTAALEESQRG